jgi:hypothetical protein
MVGGKFGDGLSRPSHAPQPLPVGVPRRPRNVRLARFRSRFDTDLDAVAERLDSGWQGVSRETKGS